MSSELPPAAPPPNTPPDPPAPPAKKKRPPRKRKAASKEPKKPRRQTFVGPYVNQGRGEPTACTPDVQDKIIACVKLGMSIRRTAPIVGISRTTLDNWRVMAQGGVQPYADFWKRYEAAKVEGEAFFLGIIASAAPKTWQAAAWMLERTKGNRYKQQARFELTGKGGGPILKSEIVATLSDDQIERMLKGETPAAVLGAAAAGIVSDDEDE